MKKCAVFLLLIFSFLSGSAQNKEIDSLTLLLEARPTIDESYVDILNDLSFEYAKNSPIKASRMIDRAIHLSDSIQYKKGKYRATINKGSLFWVKAIYDQALKNYLSALNMGHAEDSMGRYILYNNIGEVFKKEQQYDSSYKYLTKALAIANNMEGVYPSLLIANIAELHLLQDQVDSAEHLYIKAIEIAEKVGNNRGLSYGLFGLAEIAAKKNDLSTAIDLHQQSLMLRKELADSRAIVQSLLSLGEYFRLNRNYLQSRSAVTEAKEMSLQSEADDLLLECYLQDYELFSIVGEHQQAANALNNYLNLEKKMDKVRENNMAEYVISSLQAEISQNELMLSREQLIMQRKTMQSQLWLILMITLVLIILLAFLQQYTRRIRQTKQSNEKLTRLNAMVISKSEEISKINKHLDEEVKSKTEDLRSTNQRLMENKVELSKNLEQKNIITEQLLRSNRMLTDSQKISKLGSWAYNVVTREMSFTDETYRQFGIMPGSVKPSLELLQKHTSDEDFSKIRNAIENIKSDKLPQAVQVELINAKSQPRTILVKMVPEIMEGSFLRVYGSNLDITESVLVDEREKKFSKLLLDLSNQSNLIDTDFASFLEQLLVESSKILQVSRASYWQYDETVDSIECLRLYDGESLTFTKGFSLYAKDYPRYFEALHDHRTIDASNANSDPRTSEFASGYLKEFDIKSMLDAQIQIDNQLRGVLCFENTVNARAWNHSEQRFVGSLVDIICNALSNYRNLCLTREKEELIKKLSQQNQNLEEFAYVTSHNLRGPTAQILGLINLLGITDDQESIDKLLTCLKESGHALDQVINDLATVLYFQEIKQDEMTRVSLSQTVQEVMTQLDELIPDREKIVELNFKKDLSITTYEQYLSNIVLSIFTNSIKFSKPGKKPVIRFSAYEISDRVFFEFEDNGLGVDLPRFKDKIFKMYQRFHLGIEGKGIGLFIVKNQVELLGGKITLESSLNKGTKITIVLPKHSEPAWSRQAIPL